VASLGTYNQIVLVEYVSIAGAYVIAAAALYVGWSAKRQAKRDRIDGVRRDLLIDRLPEVGLLEPAGARSGVAGVCVAPTVVHLSGKCAPEGFE